MKIISKFKDFYDYKMTKYGVDEKLVYTRKNHCEYVYYTYYNSMFRKISEEEFNENFKDKIPFFKENNFHKILFIGEKLIHLFFTENGVYTHFDIKNTVDLSKKYERGWIGLKGDIYSYYIDQKEITFKDGKKYLINSIFRYDWLSLLNYDRKRFFSIISKDKGDILFNEPIILIEYIGKYDEKIGWTSTSIYKFTYNPYLSKLNVYIDEDFVWQSLVEFLSMKRSEKEIVPEVSNENKILSKGFDLKTSFRSNMKKKK